MSNHEDDCLSIIDQLGKEARKQRKERDLREWWEERDKEKAKWWNDDTLFQLQLGLGIVSFIGGTFALVSLLKYLCS